METLWYKYLLKLFHTFTCFAISRLLLQNQCLSLRQLVAGMRVYRQCVEKWSWFCLRVCFNCSSLCSKPYGMSRQEFICKLTSSVTPKIVVRTEWSHPRLFTKHLPSAASYSAAQTAGPVCSRIWSEGRGTDLGKNTRKIMSEEDCRRDNCRGRRGEIFFQNARETLSEDRS